MESLCSIFPYSLLTPGLVTWNSSRRLVGLTEAILGKECIPPMVFAGCVSSGSENVCQVLATIVLFCWVRQVIVFFSGGLPHVEAPTPNVGNYM